MGTECCWNWLLERELILKSVWTSLNTDVDMETRWTVLRDLRINEYVMNLACSHPNQKRLGQETCGHLVPLIDSLFRSSEVPIYSHADMVYSNLC